VRNVFTTHGLNLAFPRIRIGNWQAGVWLARGVIFLVLVAAWCGNPVLADDRFVATGTVEGTVYVGANDVRSPVARATVRLSGAVNLETTTTDDGKYVFSGISPGQYTVEATSPGIEAVQTITIEAGRVVELMLQLKPHAVKTYVDVNASETDLKIPSPTSTINEKTISDAPNTDERLQSLLPLIPGVVRGPDGHINLKGASNTQSGALVNSAAINLPIDVVSSVQVISNPYDPQYGRFTGAVSNVETKTGNYKNYHFSVQNVLPRMRNRDGHIVGLGAATPRMTFTGPIVKDRVAFTQSFEYRFVRTPVNSLPQLQRDTELVGYDSYTQSDLNLTPKQTATVSLAVFPQKLEYMGLNTFTPQPSTADFHQRGYQIYGQHRDATGAQSVLVSQFSYQHYDADVTPLSNDPYQLLIDTTKGGYFDQQARRTHRLEWGESYDFAPLHYLGVHELRAGLNYAYSSYNGKDTFQSVEIIGSASEPIERITFTAPTSFGTTQSETSWFLADRWSPTSRLTLSLGARFDSDTVTSSIHLAPRVGFLLALTSDGKTLLKGGVGLFYDRVPLIIPTFEKLPYRTVSLLDANGQTSSSVSYLNRITGGIRNPQSTSWSLTLERQVLEFLTLRAGYEQRNTSKVLVVSPASEGSSGTLALSNSGRDSYQEYQVAGRLKLDRFILNSSYVYSRAFGNLNDPSLFFGNYPQAVIQPDARARLPFDARNRFLFWGDFQGPWKLNILPVYDLHTGFPYSVENQFREYVGPRNTGHFPRFSSCDLQVLRPVSLHIADRHLSMRAGFTVFNLFNHFTPRDVQNIEQSSLFGEFFNDAWREYRGKLVFQF
jgi:Carboxypeptidase regulatory-like domain